MIRVLLADDHELVRFGVERLVSAQSDMEVAGSAVDGLEAVALALVHLPDLVLMDLSMPGLDGIAATREILHRVPDMRVLVLTSYCHSRLIRDALAAGACGYLIKDSGSASLLDGIRAAARGEHPMSAAAREAYIA